MSEPARCLCGSLRFQLSSNLPDSCVVCEQCFIVWELNDDGCIQICMYPFPEDRKKEIIQGMDGVRRSFKATTRQTSILDLMVEP